MYILKRFRVYLLSLVFIISFVSCSGGDVPLIGKYPKGVFIDDIVQGIYYKSKTSSGYTNEKGEFPYYYEPVEFYLGNIKLGGITSLPSDGLVFLQDILGLKRGDITNENLLKVATLLQSIDADTSTDEIEISRYDFSSFYSADDNLSDLNVTEALSLRGFKQKNELDVQTHLVNAYLKHSKTWFPLEEKKFLYDEFHTNYLWADKVEDKDYSEYTSPYQMIYDLRYSVLDKWSFAQTVYSYYKYVNQENTGFGCNFNGSWVLNYADINSPCDKVGLKRGDLLISINGNMVDSNSYYVSSQRTDVETTFSIFRDSEIIDIKITSSAYNYMQTKRDVITLESGKKVGHLIYNGFSSDSSSEIEEAFNFFKLNGIEELVIDLRYNGGGSLSIASILLDKIAGQGNQDNLQFYLLENDGSRDDKYYFSEDENSFSFPRVFFLTSNQSASASEMLIKALKPYSNVKVIGDTTSGKPVGMSGKRRDRNSNYIYWLINFSVYNSMDEGDYYSGLSPDCRVVDTISLERNDIEEPLLKEALYYIENSTCQ